MIFSRNILILLILRAVRWFLLVMPVITIFFREHGLSMEDIFWIQSTFALSVVLFEIPTGYFSDVVGRKTSLLWGMIISTFGLGLYCIVSGFWGILVAELILGLGSSFISGTDSAMLYDTLLDEGREKENKKVQGYLQSISAASEAIASIIGGVLAAISIILPFYGMFILYLIVLPLVFLLSEPVRHKKEHHVNFLKGMFKIAKYSLHEHTEIRWILLFSGAFGASTLVMTWMLQTYFSEVGVPLHSFGVLWSIYTLSLIPASFYAHRIEDFLGVKKSLLLITSLPICGFLLLAFFHSLLGLIFVPLFYLARGFGSVTLTHAINVLVPSDIRATVLSLQALMFRLVFACLSPMIGWIADVYSLSWALYSSAFLFAFLIGLPLFFMLSVKQ